MRGAARILPSGRGMIVVRRGDGGFCTTAGVTSTKIFMHQNGPIAVAVP